MCPPNQFLNYGRVALFEMVLGKTLLCAIKNLCCLYRKVVRGPLVSGCLVAEKQVTNYFPEVRDFSIQTPPPSESRVTLSDTRGGSEITMNLTGLP